MDQAAYTKLAADAIAKQFDLHGIREANDTVYSFTSEQTASGLHDKLSGELISAGIQTQTDIRIGRGKYSKGNRYAKVTVPAQEIEQSEPLEKQLLELTGINCKVMRTGDGLILSEIQNQNSAITLFQTLRRHKPRMIAERYDRFALFVPVASWEPRLIGK